jgi:RimJ/RimL family protein N-acetyltransferase
LGALVRERENAFIIEFSGRCVGEARFHDISGADRSAVYAVGIFDTSLYSQGIGTEVTRLMLDYGFSRLKLHRIELKVLEYNRRGIRCYEKCGFRRDGVLRESAFIDGAWHSDIVMSILEGEYFK